MRSRARLLSSLLVPLLIATGSKDARAGFDRGFSGPRAVGIAGALGTIGDDAWSFYFNPAQSANTNEISSFYTPSIYGLPEVSSSGISYRDYRFGVDFAAAAQTFGFNLYRETVASLNVSVPLYSFAFVGANINYNNLFIKDYGTDGVLSVDAGTKMVLSDNFTVGFAATNLGSSSLTASNDRLPQSLTGGIAYLSESLNVAVEYFKEIGYPSAVRVAAEYSPVGFVTMRAGAASGTSSFNAGLTVRFLSFEIGYGAMFHEVLGATHSFGLALKFNRPEDADQSR